MVIQIDSQTFEYDPQFSDAGKGIWRRKNDWHTISPQKIGDHLCFIKRYKKRPSGWQLMQQLTGIEDTGSPKVLTTATEEDQRDKTYYLIHDFIPGFTLKHYLRQGLELNIYDLINGVWQGLQSIHNRGFWQTDFCEENIYFSGLDKTFMIIDLDSTASIDTAPSRTKNKPGHLMSQEFSTTAMWFIQHYVDPGINRQLSLINGILLNQLQLIALITKLHFMVKYPDYQTKISGQRLAQHLYESGNLAQQYISAAWHKRNEKSILSLPIIKTILKFHFPELKDNTIIKS